MPKSSKAQLEENKKLAEKSPKDRVFRQGRWLYATVDGRTQKLGDWARESGVDYERIWNRIYRSKWFVKAAIFTPIDTTPARMHGTLDMAIRFKCECDECQTILKKLRSNQAKFIESKAPHPDDQGRWFDKNMTRYIRYRGKRQTIPEWAEELNMKTITLTQRLFELKMPIKQAFSQPVNSYGGQLIHGKKSTYDYWKCRCIDCSKANAEYTRELYARRKKA